MTAISGLQTQLKALENLQEMDLKIDSLKKRKLSIPSMLKGFDDEIKKFQAQLLVQTNLSAEIEKNLKQAKAALEINQERLTRAQGKLDNVKNTGEFSAANKEMDQLKKSSGQIEEQIKKTTEELAAFQKKCADIQALVEGAQAKRKSEGASLDGEMASLDQEIAKMASDRNGMCTGIEKRIMTHYDRVRVARKGMGLAPANGGRCRGCNMMLPPQMYNELLKWASLQSCPSCSRLLFAATETTVIQGTR